MRFVVEVGTERTSSRELREACFCRNGEFQQVSIWYLVSLCPVVGEKEKP